MISNVGPKRTWLVTEQARKGVVHRVCLSVSQSHVDNGLDQHLFDG